MYVAYGNDTVDNSAATFLDMVDDLTDVYDADAFKRFIGRKYAKSFTSVSIDPRVRAISNKNVDQNGQVQFKIEEVFFDSLKSCYFRNASFSLQSVFYLIGNRLLLGFRMFLFLKKRLR